LVLPRRTLDGLLEIAKEFRHQRDLHAYGLRPRDRLLFVGPPGCGKTVTASALASELGLPLARVELAAVVSSFLGETARNIATIFDYCSRASWVLLFDELDAVAKERGDRSEHGELKRVVASFLQQLDQFRGRSIVIATTNHPLLLDYAVWRRFEGVLMFEPPSAEEVTELIELKLRSARYSFTVEQFATQMRGLNQAEIESVCHAAIRRALMAERSIVDEHDMARAILEMEDRKRALQQLRG
jgi:SpoVK/Ycf46/Vps4 family AAA+-type ATPase